MLPKMMNEADIKAAEQAALAKRQEIDRAVMAAKYGEATDEQLRMAVAWLIDRYHSDGMARALSNGA